MKFIPGKVFGDGGKLENYSRGKCIYHCGDEADDVFILDAGRVKTLFEAEDGRERIVEIIRAGGLFGIEGLLEGVHNRRTSAVAFDKCTVKRFGREKAREMIQAEREWPGIFEWSLEQELLRLESYKDHYLLPPKDRLVKFLVTQGLEEGGYVVKMTQQELADAIGVARQKVNQLLKKLEQEGLVKLRPRRVYVASLIRKVLRVNPE